MTKTAKTQSLRFAAAAVVAGYTTLAAGAENNPDHFSTVTLFEHQGHNIVETNLRNIPTQTPAWAVDIMKFGTDPDPSNTVVAVNPDYVRCAAEAQRAITYFNDSLPDDGGQVLNAQRLQTTSPNGYETISYDFATGATRVLERATISDTKTIDLGPKGILTIQHNELNPDPLAGTIVTGNINNGTFSIEGHRDSILAHDGVSSLREFNAAIIKCGHRI